MSPDADLEAVYREEGGKLWWALLAYSGDRDVASDAVAEAFAQALARGSAIRSPSAWIWKAAFRIAGGDLKQRRRVEAGASEQAYEMPEPSDVLIALSRLSERQRAAIVLHYYAGYSLKEIAQILGSAKPTIGVHLTRGRRRLRELLEDQP